MEEIWKDIKNYEGLYQISNLGRVKSLGNNKYKKDKILKFRVGKFGYGYLHLSKHGKEKTAKIHRLVAEAFISNPDNKETVNHIDGNKLNNNANNLEWCTIRENSQHRNRTGLSKARYGKDNHLSKEVIQYDLKMNEISRYGSTREAQRMTGYKQTYISACCLGKYRTAYNYIWKYEEG